MTLLNAGFLSLSMSCVVHVVLSLCKLTAAMLTFVLLGEVMAVCLLDNQQVAQTPWKVCNQQCWDQRFDFDLDKVSAVRLHP